MLRMTPDGPRRDLPLDHAKAALRLALKLCGVWQRGLANGLDICYRTVELGFARLPRAFDGYRILHISDPHFDACDGLAEAIVRTVAGAEVDLCVLTGDFRGAERGPFTQTAILEPLAAIRRSVRAGDGFWATLGNHDAADMVAAVPTDRPARSDQPHASCTPRGAGAGPDRHRRCASLLHAGGIGRAGGARSSGVRNRAGPFSGNGRRGRRGRPRPVFVRPLPRRAGVSARRTAVHHPPVAPPRLTRRPVALGRDVGLYQQRSRLGGSARALPLSG